MIKEVDTGDRRKEPRFPINATVKVISADGMHVHSGLCCDVSRTGLKIDIKEELPVNETLKLEIEEEQVIYLAEATVAHSSKTEDGFIVGFEVKFEPELPE